MRCEQVIDLSQQCAGWAGESEKVLEGGEKASISIFLCHIPIKQLVTFPITNQGVAGHREDVFP